MLSTLKDYLPSSTLILLMIIAYILYSYLTSTFDFWLDLGVPFHKPWPLFGNFANLLLFQKSQVEGISEMYNWFTNERFGGLIRVRSPMLMLRDPDLIKAVCVKDFTVFRNRGIPVNNTSDPLSGHLFNLEGDQWKNLRAKLTPAFSSGKLKNMFYLLSECSSNLENLIERKLIHLHPSLSSTNTQIPTNNGIANGISNTNSECQEIEVRELATNFTIDVIGSCAFGLQINALTGDECEFKIVAKKLSKPSYKSALWRMLRVSLPSLYKALGVQVIDASVTNFFLDVVSQMIKQRGKSSTKRHDFMDLLIELKNKGTLETHDTGDREKQEEESEKIVMDDQTIAAQAFVFFVAGFETSSNTIAFCLYELAVNPEIQEKVRDELTEALNEHDGELTYDAIQNMKYLDLVILETLRKYPPAPMLSRRCEIPYKIPGSDVELPKGMRVIIPIYAIQHDSEHYPEPELFKPERFNEENKRTRHPYTFLPFGEGPRSCIGVRFALLQTKVGVITFLKKYRVDVCEKTDLPIKFSRRSLVTASETGIWLKISRLER
ncbi:hypothetical protein QAD02_009947 [Eretmocerus hayati]|uniref:Uncharacterized protein n=1 Tax=Eretmocerus hayati TaxID=131215 RepID=A0ACC2ND59_9HYME|nr:hypothetical protein QAD02_009947 [Eretmocerus hayati]